MQFHKSIANQSYLYLNLFLNDWQLQTFVGNKKKKGCKLHLRSLSPPQLICDKNCRFVGGVCLLAFRASILWRVGEADTDMVSLLLAEPGPAADSRFYLMWMSRVGFQCWLQHMISIMTRGGTHAGGWLVTLGRQERAGRCKKRWRKANRWRVA